MVYLCENLYIYSVVCVCVCVYLYRYMDLFNVTSSKFQMVSIQPFCLCKNHGGNSEEALFTFHLLLLLLGHSPLSLSLSSSTSSLYFSFLSFIHTETQKHLQFLHALKEMITFHSVHLWESMKIKSFISIGLFAF